jgi:hypothetical protein
MAGGISRMLARGLIRGYQLTFSAFVGRSCRYLPTCSDYTNEAIDRFGVWPGIWMGIARIGRCRPGGQHGYDPVPDELREGVWYLPWKYGVWRLSSSEEETE